MFRLFQCLLPEKRQSCSRHLPLRTYLLLACEHLRLVFRIFLHLANELAAPPSPLEEICTSLGRNSGLLDREFWDSRKQQDGRKVDCRRETSSKRNPHLTPWGTTQGKTKQDSCVSSGKRLLPALALTWWWQWAFLCLKSLSFQNSYGLYFLTLYSLPVLCWLVFFTDFETAWRWVCCCIHREWKGWTVKAAPKCASVCGDIYEHCQGARPAPKSRAISSNRMKAAIVRSKPTEILVFLCHF